MQCHPSGHYDWEEVFNPNYMIVRFQSGLPKSAFFWIFGPRCFCRWKDLLWRTTLPLRRGRHPLQHLGWGDLRCNGTKKCKCWIRQFLKVRGVCNMKDQFLEGFHDFRISSDVLCEFLINSEIEILARNVWCGSVMLHELILHYSVHSRRFIFTSLKHGEHNPRFMKIENHTQSLSDYPKLRNLWPHQWHVLKWRLVSQFFSPIHVPFFRFHTGGKGWDFVWPSRSCWSFWRQGDCGAWFMTGAVQLWNCLKVHSYLERGSHNWKVIASA